jgi:hypothetical protein
MNSLELATLIRDNTRQTSGTYPDAKLLFDINLYQKLLASKIQRHRPNIWHMPAFFNLEENTREYAQPQDILNSIVSLELKLDDNYVLATGLKEAPKIPLTEDAITGGYTNTDPYYFLRRKALYILSGEIATVEAGGKLTYNAYPEPVDDLVSTTDLSIDPSTTKHGFPEEFHELWARRVQIAYKSRNDIPLNEEERRFDVDLERALEEFSEEDQSLETIANVPDSSTLGGDGYDY